MEERMWEPKGMLPCHVNFNGWNVDTCPLYNITLGKVHITPSNYNPINNVSHKLSIAIVSLQTTKILSMSP